MPSVSCFGFEDGPEVRPACVAAGLGEVAIPHHAGDLHLFAGEGVVVAKEVQRRLVVEVRALALHRLVRLGEQSNGLAAAMTPLLASGDAPLRLRALLLAASVVRGFATTSPSAVLRKTCSPTSIPASRPAAGNGCTGTSAQEKHAYQPSASREIVTVLRDRLGGALEWPMPTKANPPDLGEAQQPPVHHRAVVIRGMPSSYGGEVKLL